MSDRPPFDVSTDLVFGGAGDDLIDAYNAPAYEDVVYCGPGDDLVYTDGADRLIDCEAFVIAQEPDPWDLRYYN